MKTIGNITLPVKEPQKVVYGSDMQYIDFMLDLKMDDLNKTLKELEEKDIDSGLFLMYSRETNCVGILMYKPPPQWRTYKDQKYLVFISPDLRRLLMYFDDMMKNSGNGKEIALCGFIKQYILDVATNVGFSVV